MSDFRDILGMDKSAEKKQKKKATPAASKEPEEAKRAVVGTLGKRSESLACLGNSDCSSHVSFV